MILKDVMDELAGKLRTIPALAGRTSEWPVGSPGGSPWAIVTYPEDLQYDQTGGRGLDRYVGPMVWIALADPVGRTTRNTASDLERAVKTVLEGEEGDYASCHTVAVQGSKIEADTLAGVDKLFVIFTLEIYGPGAS